MLDLYLDTSSMFVSEDTIYEPCDSIVTLNLTINYSIQTTGKSLEELIEEVYGLVGAFKYWRDDLHIDEKVKNAIVKKCNKDQGKSNFSK
ncbi:hypothetical protein N9K77_02090 [bacterium]|nr:hypothetical protein [bacterium]